MNVNAIDARHCMVEQQARLDLVDPLPLSNRPVGVPENMPGFAGQVSLAPDLRGDNRTLILARSGREQPWRTGKMARQTEAPRGST